MRVIVFSDGKAGHLNQSLGVVAALGETPEVMDIHQKSKTLECLKSIEEPAVFIGVGKKSQYFLKWAKKHVKGAFTVLMMRPYGLFGLPLSPKKWQKYFDVVAMLNHDVKGMSLPENAVVTLGAPNKVQPKLLNEAKLRFSEELNAVADKKIAVLVGGSSKRFSLNVEEFTKQIVEIALKEGAGLLVTMSRRTSELEEKYITDILAKSEIPSYIWDGKGDNPMLGYFACADAFVVTAESISMISEACSTGKPVFVYGLNEEFKSPSMGKFNAFYAGLRKFGCLLPMSADLPEHSTPVLNDAQKVADFICARLKK